MMVIGCSIFETMKPVANTSASAGQTWPSLVRTPSGTMQSIASVTRSGLARSAGVQLSSISPAPTDPTTGATLINLSVSGDFYSLTDLLYRLRSLVAVHNGALEVSGRLFSITSVGLTPSGTGRILNASVTLNAFTFGAAAQTASATLIPNSWNTLPMRFTLPVTWTNPSSVASISSLWREH